MAGHAKRRSTTAAWMGRRPRRAGLNQWFGQPPTQLREHARLHARHLLTCSASLMRHLWPTRVTKVREPEAGDILSSCVYSCDQGPVSGEN